MESGKKHSLIMGGGQNFMREISQRIGRGLLLSITAIPTLAIIFMIFFIAKEAAPFFGNLSHTLEFFTSSNWAPSSQNSPHFGALAIFYGTAMVTLGSCVIAIPLGIFAAVCLNEISKKAAFFKPMVELLAAIPSVVYGFFAIVIFAPILQEEGGILIAAAVFLLGTTASIVIGICAGEIFAEKAFKGYFAKRSVLIKAIMILSGIFATFELSLSAANLKIESGTNAFNASVILAIMALPTIVSLSQDALQAVGRDMREGSLALGATRAETIIKVVLPCAKSGIAAAIILGLMRVIGETMVVWMASGNALKIPEPFFNFFEPVRTMTATIAGEMGEADQSTGSDRYHVLFAMSFCLLIGALIMNAAGQFIGGSFRTIKK